LWGGLSTLNKFVGRAINFESFALRVIKFGRFSASLHQAGEGRENIM